MRGHRRLIRLGPISLLLVAGATSCAFALGPPDQPPSSPAVSVTPTPSTPGSGDPDAIRAAAEPLIRDAQEAAEAGVGPVTWSSDEPELRVDTASEGACTATVAVDGDGAPPKDYDLDALLPDLNAALADHDFAETSDFDYAGGWVLLKSSHDHGASFDFRAKGRVAIRVKAPVQCPQ